MSETVDPDVTALIRRIAKTPPAGLDYEELPSLSAAWAMFDANPGLSSVLTESGMLSRNGELTTPPWSSSIP